MTEQDILTPLGNLVSRCEWLDINAINIISKHFVLLFLSFQLFTVSKLKFKINFHNLNKEMHLYVHHQNIRGKWKIIDLMLIICVNIKLF